MQQLFNAFISNPKRLFLADGVGACLTALLIAGVLIPFQNYFGMPEFVLKILLLFAVTFMIYSPCCYFLLKDNWLFFLRIIALANSFYCCLTAFFVIRYLEQITVLGISYFVLEVMLILGLVFLELRTSDSEK